MDDKLILILSGTTYLLVHKLCVFLLLKYDVVEIINVIRIDETLANIIISTFSAVISIIAYAYVHSYTKKKHSFEKSIKFKIIGIIIGIFIYQVRNI